MVSPKFDAVSHPHDGEVRTRHIDVVKVNPIPPRFQSSTHRKIPREASVVSMAKSSPERTSSSTRARNILPA